MPGHKVIRKFSTLWRSSAPWPRNRGSQNNSGTACVRLRNHRQRHLVAKWDWLTSSVGVKPIYHQPSTINRIMSDTYCPVDQLRRGRATWRSAVAADVAKSLFGGGRQTCIWLSGHRPRFRRSDLRLPWTGGTSSEGLHEKAQAHLST